MTNNPINAPAVANQLVQGAGTHYTQIGYSATPDTSNIVSRDSNGNTQTNNFVSSQSLVVSAAGTTVLTAASSRIQQLTGTQVQTFTLPDATTLSVGWTFEFNNNSTGTLTVHDSTGGNQGSVPAGGYGIFTCSSIALAAGTWDKRFLIPANGSYGTSGLSVTGTITSSSLTANAPVVANSSKVLTSSALTNGQLLIGNTGTVPTNNTLTAGNGIEITNGAGTITISGVSESVAYTNVTNAMSPYTVLNTDNYLSVDCSLGPVTLNFPNLPSENHIWVVKDRTGNSSTNNITITTPGGVLTFDDGTSYVMNVDYMAINLLANSTPNYEVF